MGIESTEVQIARLEERLTQILREMELNRHDRKGQYEKLEQVNESVTLLGTRVKGVEDSLAKATPTLDEFITIKTKVVGAGAVGKWLWAGGSSLITILALSRETIFSWFAK